jgi:hypothetical protein
MAVDSQRLTDTSENEEQSLRNIFDRLHKIETAHAQLTTDIALLTKDFLNEVKDIRNLLTSIATGQTATCITHKGDLTALALLVATNRKDFDELKADQIWLRKQWTVAWMSIGGSVLLLLLGWALTHLGVKV